MTSTLWRVVFLILSLLPFESAGASREEMPPVSSAEIELKLAPGSPKIEGLEIKKSHMKPGSSQGESRPIVVLSGQYNQESRNLVLGPERVRPDKNGRFSIEIPVNTSKTYVQAVAIDVRGQLIRSEYVLIFQKWDLYSGLSRTREGKANIVTVASGLSYSSYEEDLTPSFSQLGLTVSAEYRRLIWAPLVDFRASVDSILLPLISSTDSKFSTVGINVISGVVLPWVKEPWRLSILVGYYSLSMFVAHNAFGFSGAAGPQLYPTVHRYLPNGGLVSAYVKFSPVSDSFELLPASSNREIAFGVRYAFDEKKSASWKVGMDFVSLQLDLSGIGISSSSLFVYGSREFSFQF